MPYGYNGKILHVNLTDRSWTVEEPDELFYRRYMGGGMLASYYMLKHIKPGTDPLSPENVMVFATSVITGASISGFSRVTVAAKSPLTGGFGETEAGGYFGPEMKFAGFDAIVVFGKADKPVYLSIVNGKVELRDADHLWGMENAQLQDAVREEMGDKKVRLISIGPAGEKQALLGNIMNNLVHANGRCGLGAVMGSKNLKCIAARGEASNIEYADPERLKEVGKWHRKALKSHMPNVNLSKFGTPMHTMTLQGQGILPTRNWKEGVFEGAEKLGVPGYEKILKGPGTCYRCSVACKREVNLPEGIEYDHRYGGPEFETIGSLGSMCAVDDLLAVSRAHQLCNAYGLDTIGAGCTVAFAMECFENGILTAEDNDGRVVKFGDAEGMVDLVHKMGRLEGLGAILAQGSRRAAEIIGKGAEKYVMTVKGQEPGTHDPRGKVGVALGFAVSPTGADHIEAPHEVAFQGEGVKLVHPLGILESPAPRSSGPDKVRYFRTGQMAWALNNVLGMCNFTVRPIFALTYEKLIESIAAITGWESSLYELMLAAERSIVMARVFNIREGFGRKDDKLYRRLHQALESGPAEGAVIDEKEFSDAIDFYYEIMNWDEEGNPRKAKLYELDLVWLLEEQA